MEREREPSEETIRALHHTPQGEAGDPGAHWQTALTNTQRGEYLLAGTVSKQSITLTTASLHQTEKKVMGMATETLTNKNKKSH